MPEIDPIRLEVETAAPIPRIMAAANYRAAEVKPILNHDERADRGRIRLNDRSFSGTPRGRGRLSATPVAALKPTLKHAQCVQRDVYFAVRRCSTAGAARGGQLSDVSRRSRCAKVAAARARSRSSTSGGPGRLPIHVPDPAGRDSPSRSSS